jgi:predicted LPLAT superfamily acyltransferase
MTRVDMHSFNFWTLNDVLELSSKTRDNKLQNLISDFQTFCEHSCLWMAINFSIGF